MIVVHHLAYGRSQRVLWLLEELGVPYKVVAYERMPTNLKAPSSLLKPHPLGKAPVIEDTEEGVVLGESAAIITYLLEKYGPKQTTSPEEALDDLYYTHYAEATLVPLIVKNQRMSRLTNRAPWYLRPLFRHVFGVYRELYIDADFPRHCKMIEDHLSENPWFARGSDRPTAADYQMLTALTMLTGSGGLVTDKIATLETYPSIVKYVEKVHARPTYQLALRQGDERTK